MHARGIASLLRPFGVILLIGVLCAGLVLPVLAEDQQPQQRDPVNDTVSDDGSDKLWDDDPNNGSTGDGDPDEDSMTAEEDWMFAVSEFIERLTVLRLNQ